MEVTWLRIQTKWRFPPAAHPGEVKAYKDAVRRHVHKTRWQWRILEIVRVSGLSPKHPISRQCHQKFEKGIWKVTKVGNTAFDSGKGISDFWIVDWFHWQMISDFCLHMSTPQWEQWKSNSIHMLGQKAESYCKMLQQEAMGKILNILLCIFLSGL